MPSKNTSEKINRWTASGIAAFIPGLQYAIDTLQDQLNELRAELARYQEMEVVGETVKPAKKTAWTGMSAEERSAEMKRRIAVSKRNKRKSASPPQAAA
jgi:hypothetical protein